MIGGRTSSGVDVESVVPVSVEEVDVETDEVLDYVPGLPPFFLMTSPVVVATLVVLAPPLKVPWVK